MSRPTLLIAVAAIAVLLVGMIVIAQDQGPGTGGTDTRVDAPATSVESGERGTSVQAPGTSVETDDTGTRVQAPGVDITVPRRDGD